MKLECDKGANQTDLKFGVEQVFTYISRVHKHVCICVYVFHATGTFCLPHSDMNLMFNPYFVGVDFQVV